MLILLFSLSFFPNCKEETKTIKDTGKDYYPLSIGSYYIYEVDSFLYDGINKRIDSSSSIIKDFFVEIILNSTGHENFRIERSIQVDSVTWGAYLSYTSALHLLSVQPFRDNYREMRLPFPITEFKTWDGNIYSSKAFEKFKYIGIQEPFEVGDNAFTNTAVLHKEFYEPKPPLYPLFDIYKKEIFAKGVGMVYRVDRGLNLQDGSGYEIVLKLKVTA